MHPQRRMETHGAGTAKLGSARILLVDDSTLARAIIGHGLKRAGMQVDEARSAAEALELLGAKSYDVVISDLCMPAFDDFALLATIKAQSPATEVIILSGLEDIERAMQALELGAHAYLTKPPAHPDEVLLTVRRALEMKRLRELCAQLQQPAGASRPRPRAVA
jgi:DNA-binding NtrC family response regulator